MLREMVQVVPLVMVGCCQSGSRCEQSWHADEGSIGAESATWTRADGCPLRSR